MGRGVARTHEAQTLAFGNRRYQVVQRLAAGVLQRQVAHGTQQVAAEHHPVVGRVAQCEIEVGQPGGGKLRNGVIGGCRFRSLHGRLQQLEAVLDGSENQFIAVVEVAVGRRMGYPDSTRDLADRQALGTNLVNDFYRGVEQGGPQVAVVVFVFSCRHRWAPSVLPGLTQGHILTEAAPLVSVVNIKREC